jgi:hypothetical protein
MRKIKGLRRPITTKVGDQQVQLVTIGYLARAANRTPWSIRHWQALGLMPLPPFQTNHPDPLYRRGIYPEAFVDAIAEIVNRNQIGHRLDRKDWAWFRDEIFAAYDRTVKPLLAGTVAADANRASV